jgi:hypothetical protein
MNTEIEKISFDLASQAHGLRVVDQESANRATQLVLLGKDAIKKIKDFFGPRKAKAHELWKMECDEEKAELAKVEPVVSELSSSIAEWRAAEERKRREAEMARLKIEFERRQLEAEALRRAQEAEQKAREAEARAALERDEAARRLAKVEAEKAQAEADAIIETAAREEIEAPPVPAVMEKPQTDGLAMREVWEFEVSDPELIPRKYMCVDYVKLGKVVRALKDQANIPGVRVYCRKIMASTRSSKSVGAF